MDCKKCFTAQKNLWHLMEFHVSFVNQNVHSLNLKNALFPPAKITIVYLHHSAVTLRSYAILVTFLVVRSLQWYLAHNLELLVHTKKRACINVDEPCISF